MEPETALAKEIWTELPHPLDFDWRFDEATKGAVWARLRSLTQNARPVALLGAPSLAVAALEHGLWGGPITLIDQNVPVTNQITAQHWIRTDILKDDLTRISADVIFADPPWYEEETLGFIWSAARMCRLDGYVLVSFPPTEIRPGIEGERMRLHKHANSHGLDLVQVDAEALGYDTPFFESNALTASGSKRPRPRRGDLVLYRKTRGSVSPRPTMADQPVWAEETIGESRIRLRLKSHRHFESPSLRSIVDGDILSSVSRRDPRRGKVDVWTSGNRIFQCEGTDTLRTLLRAIAVGAGPVDAIEASFGRPLTVAESSQVVLTSLKLKGLVDCEGCELRAYRESRRVDRKLGPSSDRGPSEQRAG